VGGVTEKGLGFLEWGVFGGGGAAAGGVGFLGAEWVLGWLGGAADCRGAGLGVYGGGVFLLFSDQVLAVIGQRQEAR